MADSLSLTDTLSLGNCAADTLAAASSSSLAELTDQSSPHLLATLA